MTTVETTEVFSRWLKALRDARAKAKILSRIERLADGNPGDVKSVGNGISEMRIHYGPGYRVYYFNRGETVVIILCAGDKQTQEKDIAAAKELKHELEA